jgi:hypothetical protein
LIFVYLDKEKQFLFSFIFIISRLFCFVTTKSKARKELEQRKCVIQQCKQNHDHLNEDEFYMIIFLSIWTKSNW